MGVSYTVYVVSYGDDGALVLPSAQSNTFNITACELRLYSLISCFNSLFLLAIYISQIPGDLIFISSKTSLIVSWTKPQFTPDSYTVSINCTYLCSVSPSTQTTKVVDGSINTTNISLLVPGSECAVNVTPMFDSSSSNTVTSLADTLSAGIYNISAF